MEDLLKNALDVVTSETAQKIGGWFAASLTWLLLIYVAIKARIDLRRGRAMYSLEIMECEADLVPGGYVQIDFDQESTVSLKELFDDNSLLVSMLLAQAATATKDQPFFDLPQGYEKRVWDEITGKLKSLGISLDGKGTCLLALHFSEELGIKRVRLIICRRSYLDVYASGRTDRHYVFTGTDSKILFSHLPALLAKYTEDRERKPEHRHVKIIRNN